MRIERRVATLIAVLCGVLSAAGAPEPQQTPVEVEWTANSSRVRHTPLPQPHHHQHPPRHTAQEEPATDKNGSWKKTAWQNMQAVIRKEGYTVNGSRPVECCPTVLEMVEPEGGRNQEGLYVELYRDGENKQRFFENSCRQDVVNQPCRLIDPRLQNQSMCVQKFSYTYALVRDPTAATEAPHRHRRGERHFPALPGGGGWSLDYIRVRAGCVCEVSPGPRKRKRQDRHRQRRVKGKRPHEVEDDET